MTDFPVHQAKAKPTKECEWKPDVMELLKKVVSHVELLDIPSHGSKRSATRSLLTVAYLEPRGISVCKDVNIRFAH